jgi:hypothetical protein
MFLHTMSNRSSAATVIDLDAFRQRKMRDEREAPRPQETAMTVFVPVFFCWVPVFPPHMM